MNQVKKILQTQKKTIKIYLIRFNKLEITITRIRENKLNKITITK
jgi:hypothetical protein